MSRILFVLASLAFSLGLLVAPLAQAAVTWTGVSQSCSPSNASLCPTSPAITTITFVSKASDCSAFSEPVFNAFNGGGPDFGQVNWYIAHTLFAGTTKPDYLFTGCSMSLVSGAYSASLTGKARTNNGTASVVTTAFTGVEIDEVTLAPDMARRISSYPPGEVMVFCAGLLAFFLGFRSGQS